MFAWNSHGTELRRFARQPITRAAVLVLLLIPLLYGAMYVWAFWSPTEKMDELPVALVNLDEAATIDGQILRAGDEVAKQLLANRDLDWHEVNATDAASGTKNGTYYFTVTIPRDYSGKLSSLGEERPQAAQIQVQYNDANSFLATTLGKSAVGRLREVVSSATSQQAIDKLLAGLGDARDGLGQAAEGSAQLSEGVSQLVDKTGDLTQGVTKFAQGATQYAAGAQKYSSGATALSKGSQEFTAGAQQLAAGAAQWQQGALAGLGQLGKGTQQLSEGIAGVNQLSAGAQQALAAGDTITATAMLAKIQALTAPESGQLTQGGAALAAGTVALQAELSPGGKLAQGVTKLQQGSAQLAQAQKQLSTGAKNLAAGTASLTKGAPQLSKGAKQMSDPQTATQVQSLQNGANKLSESLEEGQKKIPVTETGSSQRAQVLANPVTLKESTLNEADSWGEGFAPFFISLALWVGGLITWLLLRPLNPRALLANASGLRTVWTSLGSALVVLVGQVVIMIAVMHFAIGLKVSYPVMTLLFTLLAGAAFMALQQFFQISFGSAVGKVIAICILMLQLASSGGTYPIETEPGFLRAINPYMPMSYAVSGLRQSLTGTLDSRFWIAVVVLGAILVLSLIASAIMARVRRTWSISRLHPAIDL